MQSFGKGCRYPCSKHCLNKTCHESNGNCVYGCEMGFYGDKCDKGWFLNLYITFLLYSFEGKNNESKFCASTKTVFHIDNSLSFVEYIDRSKSFFTIIFMK